MLQTADEIDNTSRVHTYIYCTTDEGDRVTENLGCAIIVIKSNFIFKIYTCKHAIHDEIYIFGKRKENKRNNL